MCLYANLWLGRANMEKKVMVSLNINNNTDFEFINAVIMENYSLLL